MIDHFITSDGERAEVVRVLGTWRGNHDSDNGPHFNGLIVNLYIPRLELFRRHVRVVVVNGVVSECAREKELAA